MVVGPVILKRSAKTVAKPAELLLREAVLALNRSRVGLSRHAEPWAYFFRKCGMKRALSSWLGLKSKRLITVTKVC